MSSEDEALLQRQGWDELRRRARRGIVIHLPLWLLIAGASGLFTIAPGFAVANAGLFALVLVVRLWQGRRHEAGRVPVVFLSLLIANAAHWGVLSATALLWPPLHAAAWPIWVATSSVAAAGTMGLAISHRVRLGYSLAAFLPIVTGLVLAPSAQNLLLALTAVLGCSYLIGASRVVHDDYWAAARTRVELEASRRQFQHLSFTDALTQVPNRLFFEHSLTREWQRSARAGSALSVLMIDIDHFKRINDRFGHAIGDASLRSVATVLGAGLKRGNDLIARYGGEEFIVLLTDTGVEAACEVGERLRRGVVELDLTHGGERLPITCSIGVASARPGVSNEPHDGPTQTILAADKALYRAKRDGRNRVERAEEAVIG